MGRGGLVVRFGVFRRRFEFHSSRHDVVYKGPWQNSLAVARSASACSLRHSSLSMQ